MAVRHFEAVATATVRRKRLHIVHFNRGTGALTDRFISPQQMVYYRDNWHVDCWCHLRKAIRTFSIDAIESAELLWLARRYRSACLIAPNQSIRQQCSSLANSRIDTHRHSPCDAFWKLEIDILTD
ncbi:MAG: WYL domain-containing protein [Glaciimonas sp.]|nr:WYL domain-containing protein [Glaciimonas sp.]